MPAGSDVLTAREREVATLIAAGLTSRAIAEQIHISERTVDAHADHIRTKLGLRSRAEIAAWVVRSSVSAESQGATDGVTVSGSLVGVSCVYSFGATNLMPWRSAAAMIVSKSGSPMRSGRSLNDVTGVLSSMKNRSNPDGVK